LSLKTRRRKVKLEKSKKKEGKEKISSLLPSKNYLHCISINNKESETSSYAKEKKEIPQT
jgi:hypothetical protein